MMNRPLFRIMLILFAFLSLLGILLIYGSLPDVSILKTKNPRSTAFIELRKKQAAQNHQKFRVRQSWVSFRDIPKLFRQSVRISEDASFYSHKGIDFEEMKIAIERDYAEGHWSRGASTITQQLAKNLYLSEDKTIVRKIKEYLIARRLEHELSKYRIFHLYLNLIEFGPGVFGVQAAAHYYFGKPVSDLELHEMVRLAAIIPQPLKLDPNRIEGWLQWKATWILKKLKKYKYIDEQQYQYNLFFLQ